jgi:hypothetical protein
MTTQQIYVEAVGTQHDLRNAKDELGDGAEYMHGGLASAQSTIATFDPVLFREGVATVCAAVSEALKDVSPESWSVEINLGFKAGLKVPVLISGEANAALKVVMNWKRPS